MPVTPEDVRLEGRVAVVTGGGAGIGRGVAAGLVTFGAAVAIWERDSASCARAAQEIGALGIETDVRDGAAVDAALRRTVDELGIPSILVNNAGGAFSSPLLDTSENGWDALYKANLRHVLLCTQRVARAMVSEGLGGSVINLTSIEGTRAAPGFAAYAAAKAGVINYTKTAALELAPHGIRVNALAPDLRNRASWSTSVTWCRWAALVMSTRWQAPPCFSRPTCRATSRARPSMSTAARTQRQVGTTIPSAVTMWWGRREALGDLSAHHSSLQPRIRDQGCGGALRSRR
jgi:3-oxoacyl-[acyl-carrier protein] reductase